MCGYRTLDICLKGNWNCQWIHLSWDMLIPRLTFAKHVKKRAEWVRIAVNSVWKRVFDSELSLGAPRLPYSGRSSRLFYVMQFKCGFMGIIQQRDIPFMFIKKLYFFASLHSPPGDWAGHWPKWSLHLNYVVSKKLAVECINEEALWPLILRYPESPFMDGWKDTGKGHKNYLNKKLPMRN